MQQHAPQRAVRHHVLELLARLLLPFGEPRVDVGLAVRVWQRVACDKYIPVLVRQRQLLLRRQLALHLDVEGFVRRVLLLQALVELRL